MPNPITIKKHRTWCKSCLEFTIHSWLKIDLTTKLYCENCETEETGYSFKEIPEDKLLLQRQRYKEMERKNFEKLLSVYTNPVMDVLHMMSEPGSFTKIEIIEDDAGQKRINENEKIRLDEAKKLWDDMKQDYNDNYKYLNNNDKCPCGSGLKYKKCHLIHWRKYEIAKN